MRRRKRQRCRTPKSQAGKDAAQWDAVEGKWEKGKLIEGKLKKAGNIRNSIDFL